jgi:hypothetical protein
LFGVSAASCTPAAARTFPGTLSSAPDSRVGVSDRLYFGRSIPGGGFVSEADWTGFLRDVVTPRFPEGLTVWAARGQWRDSSGVIVQERSFVLELIHPADARLDASVAEIIAEYKHRFRQEAVLRVQDRVEVSGG